MKELQQQHQQYKQPNMAVADQNNSADDHYYQKSRRKSILDTFSLSSPMGGLFYHHAREGSSSTSTSSAAQLGGHNRGYTDTSGFTELLLLSTRLKKDPVNEVVFKLDSKSLEFKCVEGKMMVEYEQHFVNTLREASSMVKKYLKNVKISIRFLLIWLVCTIVGGIGLLILLLFAFYEVLKRVDKLDDLSSDLIGTGIGIIGASVIVFIATSVIFLLFYLRRRQVESIVHHDECRYNLTNLIENEVMTVYRDLEIDVILEYSTLSSPLPIDFCKRLTNYRYFIQVPRLTFSKTSFSYERELLF